MAAFKVPKSFLGYEEDNSGKASLAAQDVRFARTIERIQRIVVSELTKIAIIHLYVQGFTDEELIDFELEMTSPSVIYEQEKLNLWKEKVSLAEQIANSKFLSRDWVYHNILQIAQDDAKEEQKKVEQDMQMLAKLDAAQQQPTQPEQPTQPAETPAAEEPAPEDQKIDSVADVLASLEDMPTEDEGGDDSELEEAKIGRPKEGQKYGQDSHPRGRDPLGHKENLGALRVGQLRKPTKKSPLSLENHEVSNLIKQLNAHKSGTAQPSILSEDNILDIEN